jgi:PTH1 family peptidyl-tRNA hydrolase
MFLVVGLGNPGKQYRNNRHNVGFMVIDKIVDQFDLISNKEKFDSDVFIGEIGDHKVIAVKPNTYMNLSGKSVSGFIKHYKIPLSSVIVIHDDIDLAFGKVKTKFGGGTGGHNGLKSIDGFIGQNYNRLRIGVSHPGDRDMVSDFVLSDFEHGTEKDTMNELISSIAKNFNILVDSISSSGAASEVPNNSDFEKTVK